MREFPPLDHGDYAVLDIECSCSICTEWRKTRKRYYSFTPNAWKKVCRGELVVNHSRACTCKVCLDPKYKKSRTAYLGATERRNLYCESSWHAESNPVLLGELYLSWLKDTLADRETRSDGWWEGRSPYLPIQYWITQFRLDMRAEADQFKELMVTVSGIPKAAVGLLATALASSGNA